MVLESSNKPKNIVLLSDGTGNSAAKIRRTNVWRMYEAIDLRTGDQMALYDDGVGTSSFKPMAWLGGALGYGLKRNVRDLYTFACRNYVPAGDGRDADRLYVFVLSRGAFTERVLVALIEDQGLIQNAQGAELDRLARWAYREYRKKFNVTGGLVTPLRKLRDWAVRTWQSLRGMSPYTPSDVKPDIEFVGLWDTVDAYGMPIDEMKRGWDQWVWPLSMVKPTPPANVKKVCHALALDDERQTFHPLLIDEGGLPKPEHTDQERVTQVWFAGAHSDVGGGYPDDSLSHVAMLWMATEASKHQLRLHPVMMADWEARADPNGPAHDSRRGFGSYYRYQPRSVTRLSRDKIADVRVPWPKVHESVFTRIRSARQEYAPVVLPENYVIVRNGGSIVEPANNPVEHPSQSKARAIRQESVWDLVWQRRIVYFLTVTVTLLILVPSLVGDRYGAIDQGSVALSGVIQWTTQWLPEQATPLAAHYQRHPVVLLTLLIVFALLYSRSVGLQNRIRDVMRKEWDVILGSGRTKVPSARPAGGIAYGIRTHPIYQGMFRLVTQHVFPLVFGVASLLALVLILVGTSNRAVFAIASSYGSVCSTSATTAASFNNNVFCHATGIELQQGNLYEVRLELLSQWRDGEVLTAWLNGFSSTRRPSLFVPALPFRRVLTADWFVPVAKIGNTGAEYHLFQPVDRSDKTVGQEPRYDQAVAVITPRRTGQLFLFVNDAIAPVVWDYFYRNNQDGPASVTVRRLGGGASTMTASR